MKPTHETIKGTDRARRGRRRTFSLLVSLLLAPIAAWGQALVPDDPRVPQAGRIPLVLVQGLCGDRETWTREGGLTAFVRSHPSFGEAFKLYHFEHPTAPATPGGLGLCGDGTEALTSERVRGLAAALRDALAEDPAIGPDREIAIVAHSSGGLVARAFLEELGQAGRTQVAITLATPHHGTIRAKDADDAAGQPGQHAVLYWDGHDGGEAGANPWLRCLNGLAPAEAACDSSDGAARADAWGRIVAIGLARPESLGDPYPDDGLVPLQSALFDGAGPGLRRRYAGLGGQEAGSACQGDASAHLAILHEDCQVADVSGGPAVGVFAAVSRELGVMDPEPMIAELQALDALDFPPDLIVTLVAPSPSLMAPGQTIAVGVATKNNGLGSSGSSTTRFYLSGNQTKETGDKLLTGTQSVPALAAGATRSNSVSVTIPATMAPGTYYLLACADDKKTVAEASETNNCLAGSQVTVARPDLVVTAVADPPQAIAPGAGFGVTDTTKNQGSVPSGATKTRYYLSSNQSKGSGDKLLAGARSVPALNAGQSHSSGIAVTVPASTPSGWYYLLACADDQVAVKETDETNNCRASVEKVYVGKPDLQTTFVSNPPPVVIPGWDIYLQWVTVYNASQAPAPSSRVRFYLSADAIKSTGDRLLTGELGIPALGAFDDYSANFGFAPVVPAATPIGTYYLLACADGPGDVAEKDETNNCLASTTTVSVTRPDLVVSLVSTPATTVAPGAIIQVTDTTVNQGLVYAWESTTRYYLSADQVRNTGDKPLSGSRPVPLLSGGDVSAGTVSVTVPLSTTPGAYWLLACADTGSVVIELSETNNCKASAAQVTIAP